MIALGVMGLATAAGMLVVVVRLGDQYAADEHIDPWVTSADIPTEPWPAPR